MLMETSVGSPRSSSGYGSSEEDHQQLRHHHHHHHRQQQQQQQQQLEQERTCLRLRRVSYPATSCSTSPQTPDSCISPSEPTSCLNSPDPFSIDFQSVFESDDVLPDWSNIDGLTSSLETGFDDLSLPTEHWYNDGLPWTTDSESTVPCTGGVCPAGVCPGGNVLGGESVEGVVVKIEPEDTWSEQSITSSPEEGHILVSLLKRSKADLDWITTGETSSTSSTSATSQEYLKPLKTTESLADSVTSSPLQRLKALTNSNVVNHTQSPRVINAAAVDMKPVINMSSAVNIVRIPVAVGSVSQQTTSLSTRPVNSCYYEQTNKQTVAVSKARTVARSTSLRTATVSMMSKSTAASRPKTSVVAERRLGQLNSVGTPRTSSVTGVRRLRTELDDHRYSTQLPQPCSTFTRCQPTPAKTARLNHKYNNNNNSNNNNNTSYSQMLSSSCPLSSSILETLLLTSEPLRPNEGSEASLAACGVVVCKAKPSSCCASPDVSTEPASSILEHLLTDPTGATGVMSSISCDIETESGIGSSDETKLSPTSSRDKYSLFSEHLLFDSHGLELFGETQQTWTPSCLDDRVMSNELEEMMQHEQIQHDENTWLQQYLTDLL